MEILYIISYIRYLCWGRPVVSKVRRHISQVLPAGRCLTLAFPGSTFVCPTEILAFNDRVEEFRALGAEVVACSIDSQFTHLAWMNTPRKEGGLGRLSIPLLSDITHTISKDYGVYLQDQGHSLRWADPPCGSEIRWWTHLSAGHPGAKRTFRFFLATTQGSCVYKYRKAN